VVFGSLCDRLPRTPFFSVHLSGRLPLPFGFFVSLRKFLFHVPKICDPNSPPPTLSRLAFVPHLPIFVSPEDFRVDRLLRSFPPKPFLRVSQVFAPLCCYSLYKSTPRFPLVIYGEVGVSMVAFLPSFSFPPTPHSPPLIFTFPLRGPGPSFILNPVCCLAFSFSGWIQRSCL